jgi:hypothetical protein
MVILYSVLWRDGSTFICYFSGHGVLEKGKLFLLLDNTDTDNIFATALSVSKILEALRYCKAQSQLLVLDCCHAGAVVNMLGLKSGIGIPVEELTIKSDNYLILMASDRLEKARELEKLRGSFLTVNICSALGDKLNEADRDKDGRISIQDLSVWLGEKADEHNKVAQKDRVPCPYLFGQSKGRFFLTIETSIPTNGTVTQSASETITATTTDGKEGDYSILQDLLQAKNWEEANRETQRVMLKVANAEKYLNADSLKDLPCPHLQKIDQLWMSASKNHFGFSVQEEIWRKYDSLNNYRKQGEKFREEVGWDIYYNVHTLNFDTKSPRGHLPCCDFFCWTWEESLSDRLLRMWHGSGGGSSTIYRAGGGIYPNVSRGYNAKSKKVLNYTWQKTLFMRVTHCNQ